MVNLLYWVGGGLGLCKIHCVSTDSTLNITDYSFAIPAGVPGTVQACDEPPPCDTLVRKLFPLHLVDPSVFHQVCEDYGYGGHSYGYDRSDQGLKEDNIELD